MKINKLIKKFENELLTKTSLQKLHFLIKERDKLDSGIFSQSGWKGSDFKEVILQMLDKGDIADGLLKRYFEDYKEKWDHAKKMFFDSTDTLTASQFLKSFLQYLPEDIVASIKKLKNTSIGDLELEDSIGIFQNYYELRAWMNKEIQVQMEENKLSDSMIQIMNGNIQYKYEWNGTAIELVGLFQELEAKKWVHNPKAPSREKAQLLLSCFTIKGTSDSNEYVSKIYKKQSWDNKPFSTISATT